MAACPIAVDAAARECLQAARSLVALTGSGISQESGVPTFRDAQVGLWERYRAEDLATPQAFERDPELVWGWYRWRRALVGKARPNSAHEALARLARGGRTLTLVTQNVDGLHQLAGSPDVIEFHGNIMRDRCSSPGCNGCAATSDTLLPRCADCGGLLRPDVVWFGEAIAPGALRRSLLAASECDVLLSVGTSSLVYPAAGLADAALACGAVVIEVNTTATPLTPRAHHVLRGPAGEMLPALVEGL